MTTGERIKQRRLELKMTVDELAQKLSKNRATIYRYESDEIENLPTSILVPLAQALKTTPAYLMGWETKDGLTLYGKVLSLTNEELRLIKENSYENLVIKEMGKMNQKGKVKLLDTAREMVCNPLYNPNYEVEVNAAHARTDIDVPEDTDTSDNDIMDDDDF